jgi:hypothetical protein
MSVTMNKAETLKNGLLGLAALAMVGALVFLYDKTQAVDLRERNEILGFLRELKEIDGRWDVDVLRARLEPTPTSCPSIIVRRPRSRLQQLNQRCRTPQRDIERMAARAVENDSPESGSGREIQG